LAGILLLLAGSACSGRGATAAAADTAPDWSKAQFVEREGRLLTVRLDASGDTIRIDLSSVGVFDCRINCFQDIRAQLGSIDKQVELCIGYLYLRDGYQQGKLWVDRYTCAAGGRVIP
jgi:hypothetical protein